MFDVSGVKDFWRRYRSNRAGLVGLMVLATLAAIVLTEPYLLLYDPKEPHFTDKLLPPSTTYPMGTDELGRDVFSRIIAGTRFAFLIGLSAAGIAALIGFIVGAIAGFYGGKLDDIMMRVTDIFLVVPTFFLIMVIAAIFGASMSLVVVAIGITSWPGPARLVRAGFLSLKEQEFVEAARLVGAGDIRIILRHIAPNTMAPLIVITSVQIAGAILTEASLSFLGLGDVNVVTWGQMLQRAQQYLRHGWWVASFPGFMIFLTVLAFNLVGDALNDALNPRLKEYGTKVKTET